VENVFYSLFLCCVCKNHRPWRCSPISYYQNRIYARWLRCDVRWLRCACTYRVKHTMQLIPASKSKLNNRNNVYFRILRSPSHRYHFGGGQTTRPAGSGNAPRCFADFFRFERIQFIKSSVLQEYTHKNDGVAVAAGGNDTRRRSPLLYFFSFCFRPEGPQRRQHQGSFFESFFILNVNSFGTNCWSPLLLFRCERDCTSEVRKRE
jgi:hypothetical protein